MHARQHIAYAARRGLSAVVITDHNICRYPDYDAARITANQLGLRTMPGIEITTVFGGVVMDILGYGFDPKSNLHRGLGLLRQTLSQWYRNRLIAVNEGEGLHIEPSSLEQGWDGFWLQWHHISRAIAQELNLSFSQGVEIFDRYFPEGFAPPITMPPDQACDLIKQAGGKSVIAHGGIYLRKAEKTNGHNMLPCFSFLVRQLQQEHGLIGLEVFHPNHDEDDMYLLRHNFSGLNLFFTGGSDFHGSSIMPHRPIGNWGVDMEVYDRFEEAVLR